MRYGRKQKLTSLSGTQLQAALTHLFDSDSSSGASGGQGPDKWEMERVICLKTPPVHRLACAGACAGLVRAFWDHWPL